MTKPEIVEALVAWFAEYWWLYLVVGLVCGTVWCHVHDLDAGEEHWIWAWLCSMIAAPFVAVYWIFYFLSNIGDIWYNLVGSRLQEKAQKKYAAEQAAKKREDPDHLAKLSALLDKLETTDIDNVAKNIVADLGKVKHDEDAHPRENRRKRVAVVRSQLERLFDY